MQIFEALDAGGRVVNAVKTRLKRAVEAGQDAVIERLHGLRLAGDAVLGYGHAARIVNQHGDDVLLRLQLGDGDGRLPQQHQQHGGQESLQAPDDPGAPTAHHRRGLRQAGADQPRQSDGRGDDEEHEHPLRPCP